MSSSDNSDNEYPSNEFISNQYIRNNQITILTGPMCSGKSSCLYRELNKSEKSLLILPKKHDCTKNDKILSRSGECFDGDILTLNDDNKISSSIGINKLAEYDIVGIDEIQFIQDTENEILNFIQSFKKLNDSIKLVCAGLDMDFLKRRFKPTTFFCKFSDKICMLKSDCDICNKKNSAIYSFRKSQSDKLFVIDKNQYYPVCLECSNKIEE